MRAIDTNLIVRILTRDNERQFERANAFVAQESVFVPITVMLECEWVLRSTYGFRKRAIIDALRNFSLIPNVVVDQADAFAIALTWAEAGMSLPDAIHLALSKDCDDMATFDTDLKAKAEMARGYAVTLLA